MAKILIIGTGLFGSALSNVLLKNKHQLSAYGTNPQQVENFKKMISAFGTKFCGKFVKVSNDLGELLKVKYDIILLTLPKNFLVTTVTEIMRLSTNKNTIFVNTAKGKTEIEKNKKITLVNMFGPSYASEVFQFNKTIVNISGTNKKALLFVQKQFNNEFFRCVINNDFHGSLILPYLKNMGAIVMGIVYNLTTSINTRA
jgi:glycerol-3-phosphate dehydrogenase (NAD(P)+)